ncbi:Transcriptional regulator, AraC family [Pseudomonas sp. FeS53a]|uniref:AraC family transcriptional regulator n=1 Tax=Pseudomonas sp. FeS53a TaxID=1604022 RepID=UPI0005DACDEB|nr:helix-turn-helix transcriptional regulator [Pseudomonas sp. FeS53a]KIV64405.1 Transcriptional regulator, AraC family [Pseudomonas sp. FeS53a]
MPAPSPRHLPVFDAPDARLRPVTRDYPDGHCTPEHWHEGAQLIYATTGVMELSCGQGCWLISPQQALWMPARLPHRLRARGPVALRTVYLRPDQAPAELPDAPYSLMVSPLLRELLPRALPVDGRTPPDSRAAHLMHLLLDEVRQAHAVPLRLPMPRDPRLQKLCLGLLEQPGDPRSLADWGTQVGASTRTLARLFRAELGTSFLLWRQRARIQAALPRLERGEAITRIAADLGYESSGAFTSAFRRLMGKPPKAWRNEAG